MDAGRMNETPKHLKHFINLVNVRPIVTGKVI